MRGLFTVALVALLAGCSGPSSDAGTDSLPGTADVPAAAPTPVDIHEVVDLSVGATRSWSFDIAPNATAVDVRFYGTGLEGTPLGGGLPACLTISTPDGEDASGICQGSGAGNILVSPYVVAVQRDFFAMGTEAKPGHYSFALDAQQSASEFHAVVTVQY